MDWQALPLAGPLFLAAGLGLLISVVVLHRRDALGSAPLLLLVVAAAVWAAAYGAEYLSTGAGAKLFWAKVAYTGASWVPAAWMGFALAYTRRPAWASRRLWLLLGLEPLATIAILWSNESHHLFWRSISRAGFEQFPSSNPGLWFDLHLVYSYALLIAGSLLLGRVMTTSLRLFRRQAAALLAVIVLPWAANLVSVLGLIPAGWPDLTPYAFPIVELLLAWNLTRWHLLDVAPVTRDLSVQGMSDGILVIDRQARIVDVNPAARRMLGWDQEHIGEPIGEVLPGELIRAMRRAAGSETGVEIQLSGEGQPGFTGYAELTLSPLRDRRSQPSGQLLALHDVTERHALLLAEQSARRAAETAQYRLAFLAEASRLLASSPDYAGTLQRVARLTVPHLADYCTVDLILDDGAISRVATAGDAPEHVGWNLTMPLLARERQLGVLTLARADVPADRDEETLLLEELALRAAQAIDNARLYREARQAVRVREDFVTTASHELKTPLTTIKGYTQILSRQLRQFDGELGRIPATAEKLTGEVRRLETLVQGLLDLSRIQESRLELRPERCDLIAIARAAIDQVTQDDPETLDRISLEAPQAVEGSWDPFRIAQVVTNLLSNAVKYSPPGGAITVRLWRGGGHAELEVRDQGIGVLPAEQAHLFQPFRRSDRARKLASGTGLGLYISDQIVRQHGGTMRVRSTPGQGSAFVVELPIETNGRAVPPPELLATPAAAP